VASRRGAEALIEAGRIRINGSTVTELATFVEPGRDRVELDGRRLNLPTVFTYLLLHKPVGTVTTASDPEGRPTVLGLVPHTPRVFPVGRLDVDTSGALILTDDGDLAHRLLHPRYKVEKEYDVLVDGAVTDDQVRLLGEGILLDGRLTGPARVEVTGRRPGRTRLNMTIREGRNRQIRRMIEELGYAVVTLARLRFGPVDLGALEPGLHRALTPEEAKGLRRVVIGPSNGSRRGGRRR